MIAPTNFHFLDHKRTDMVEKIQFWLQTVPLIKSFRGLFSCAGPHDKDALVDGTSMLLILLVPPLHSLSHSFHGNVIIHCLFCGNYRQKWISGLLFISSMSICTRPIIELQTCDSLSMGIWPQTVNLLPGNASKYVFIKAALTYA